MATYNLSESCHRVGPSSCVIRVLGVKSRPFGPSEQP